MKYLRRVIATICLLSVSVSLFADSVSATNATNTKNAVQFDSKAYAIKLNTAVKAYETKKFGNKKPVAIPLPWIQQFTSYNKAKFNEKMFVGDVKSMYNFLNASSLGSDPGLNITDGGMINGSKQEFDRIYKFEINLINLRYSILKTKAKPDSKPVSNSFFQISNEFMGVIKLMDMSGMNGIYFEGLGANVPGLK